MFFASRALVATNQLLARLHMASERFRDALVTGHLRETYGRCVTYVRYRWLPSERSARWERKPSEPHRLSIVIVTYQQPEGLDCLLASLNCQTRRNFDVIVIHDGSHDETRMLLARRMAEYDFPCRFIETDRRYDDFGHSLREIGIGMATGDFLLITNGDNYYCPRFVEFVFEAIDLHDLDIVTWDMVHSHSRPGFWPHPAYWPFSTCPIKGGIDIGAFLVRTSCAKSVGFRDTAFAGDATYFEDLLTAGSGTGVKIGKVEKTLMVHN
jgi:hypothetical protein